ncbi:MAG TPA: hypothetical protein VE870_04225 [Bacteroidales bacterium]|nr:hypothetical protein [Bacteroidales bacterium]
MQIRTVRANEAVGDDRNMVAFELGPDVYCAEEIDNPAIAEMTIPGKMHFAIDHDSIAGNRVNGITGSAANAELKLIPYYLWSNRGVGMMKVWFPE